jgi:hypothetical protein
MGAELTVAQRTICLVAFDRYDPVELDDEHRQMARRLFGDVDVIPASARRVLGVVLGARSGKSAILSALYSLWRMLTADLSMLGPGEQAFAAVVAPDKDTANQVRNFVAGRCEHQDIKPLVTSDPAGKITLKRSDGYQVVFAVRAASRGGARTRGRTYVSAVLDEACFFRDPSSGVINDQDEFDSVNARVIADGMVVVPSTPWTKTGLLWRLYTTNFGAPNTALVAHAPTLLMRENGPDWETIQAQERVARAVDPAKARREWDAEFGDTAGGLYFSTDIVSRSVEDIPARTLPPRGARVGCGGDLALVRDSAAVVVVHQDHDSDEVVVAEVLELHPEPGNPLRLSSVIADHAEVIRRHGADGMSVDQHELHAAGEHAEVSSIELRATAGGNSGNLERFTHARDIIHSGKLRIPREYQVVADQLRDIVAKPLSGGGLSFASPRRGGRHGDVARALIMALWDLDNGRVDWTEASQLNRTLIANSSLHSRQGSDAMRLRPFGGSRGRDVF